MTTQVLDPTKAAYKGLSFKLSNGKNYFLSLFPTDIPNYPGIVYPALLREDAPNVWTVIDKRQEMWNDLPDMMTSDTYTESLRDDFNATLKLEQGLPVDPADVNGDGEVSFVEKVARFLVVNFTVVDNQLVFTR